MGLLPTGGTSAFSMSSSSIAERSGAEHGGSSKEQSFKLSLTEKARTVTSVCTSGTLCTLVQAAPEDDQSKSGAILESIKCHPWGSYVDYILDEKGNPVLLVNEDSQHTKFFGQGGMVSLFVQLGGGGKQDVRNLFCSGG